MDVIVVALGSAGDVHPMVGLALALRRRGHRVLLAAAVIFAPLARSLGIEFHPLGTEEEWLEALRDPDIWHPLRGFSAIARRLILPMMRPVFEMIEERFEAGETVVAAPVTAFGARIACETLGVPLATIHLQPVLIRSVIRPPCYGFPDIVGHLPRALRGLYLRLADRAVIDPVLAAETNAFRAGLGLAPVRRLFHEWANSPRRVIGLFPEWYSPPQEDWPGTVALTGFPLYDESDAREPAPELEEFLAAGEPPVVFTAGSAMRQAAEFFKVSLDACRRGGLRGILLSQFREQVPEVLPDGVRSFDYVPFSAVLPRSAAIVHHGGIGTVAQAVAAGIPQLVVPFAHDQPDNATRIRRLGVGDFLLPKAYRPKTALSRLGALLESEKVKGECRRRAASLVGTRPIDAACDLVEGARG